jgi:hypothetical protein
MMIARKIIIVTGRNVVVKNLIPGIPYGFRLIEVLDGILKLWKIKKSIVDRNGLEKMEYLNKSKITSIKFWHNEELIYISNVNRNKKSELLIAFRVLIELSNAKNINVIETAMTVVEPAIMKKFNLEMIWSYVNTPDYYSWYKYIRTNK